MCQWRPVILTPLLKPYPLPQKVYKGINMNDEMVQIVYIYCI